MLLIINHNEFTFLGSQVIRNKRSLQFENEDDSNEDNAKWMTWSGDKDPNDFQDWKVDSEGNFYMDIPLADMTKKEEDENFDNIEEEVTVTLCLLLSITVFYFISKIE